MLRHAPLLLLLAFTAAAQPAKEDVIRFQSELSAGQPLAVPIGHGLVFRLGPADGGWEIGVGPQVATACKDTRDYAWVVNPPFRGHNSLELYPIYDFTAWDLFQPDVGFARRQPARAPQASAAPEPGTKRMPRKRVASWDFNFVLSCAGFQRENAFFQRVQRGVPATEAEQQNALQKLGTSPQGDGTIWILDSRISGEDPGKADWFRFRVEIRFPPNADHLPVPDDWH
jgi:hypothetical protein